MASRPALATPDKNLTHDRAAEPARAAHGRGLIHGPVIYVIDTKRRTLTGIDGN